MTAFNGFRFGGDNPDTELEAKRVLRLAMAELRKRRDLREELDIDPEHPGRGAITGSKDGDHVWDFLAFARPQGENHTAHPHLNLSVGRDDVRALVILPHAASPKWTLLKNLGRECFLNVAKEVLKNMRPLLAKCPGAEPRLRIYQRHWPKGRRGPVMPDAKIDLDLRVTCGDGKIKRQPEWIAAVFDLVKNKKSNIEMAIGAAFPYGDCEAIQKPDALDLVAAAWRACKPFIKKLGAVP